jgi:oxygen-independent coproporphyrinogen III oxidase
MKSLEELIAKYNRPGPRYTSYPPVPFWKTAPTEDEWINHIKTIYDNKNGVDLYVHVPYCESLCYYCGCSRIITRNHDVEENYMSLVLKEWNLYQEKLGFTPKLNSLHFGGGTPTFLSPENLDKLIKTLATNKSETFVGSIEIDPRTCQAEHLKVLKRNNISRLSLGIQDFDPLVQKAIHRDQSPQMVEALVEKIRALRFESLNFDLIYGLPKQSLETISKTFEVVNRLKPDLIAFYSYAHLPDRIKNQKLIAEKDLPTAQKKRELYEHGKKLLVENGYIDVGIDHFALPTSFLYQAKLNHNLHRNFMGYVDKKSPILIGLGPTSISDSSLSFIQNVKDINEYQDRVLKGSIPIEKGHVHNQNDLIIQEVILDIMCQGKVALEQLKKIPHWNVIENELNHFIQDGILDCSNNQISVTDIGIGFVRNVAMCFDYHLREQAHATKFSQTI